MPILGNYVVRSVLAYTMLVLLVLIALGTLFLFLSQQDDIGTGDYSSTEAMIFVALNLPTYIAQFLPVAALIGSLFALGNLARGSELVVMRASGVTTLRFCGWLAMAGILLAAIMVLLGEFIAPPLERYARQLKTFSKFSEVSFAGKSATWVRDGQAMISIEQQTGTDKYGGIQIFLFDTDRRLVTVATARAARVQGNNQWLLEDYAETRFTDEGTQTSRSATREVRSSISPDFLGLAVVEPGTMGLRGLRDYANYLRANDLTADRYEVAFWSRIARIFAVLLVVMLALPFALGPMRSSGQGARAVIGILIGAGFILLSNTLESSGQLLGLPPLVVGWLPSAILAMLTLVLLARAR
jgi:lipopolysaccharide export system permease protein